MADEPLAPAAAAPGAPAPNPGAMAAPAPNAVPGALKADLERVAADVGQIEAANAAPARAATPSAGTLSAIILNGLSNGPISQSTATWNHLNTRLPEIVAAIMKEL